LLRRLKCGFTAENEGNYGLGSMDGMRATRALLSGVGGGAQELGMGLAVEEMMGWAGGADGADGR
jgi:hypothetical protein